MPGVTMPVMIPPFEVMETDSMMAWDASYPVRDAHERADRVRDHKEHEHGHRLLYSIGGKNASSQMVIGNDNASRRGRHRLLSPWRQSTRR